MMSLVSKRVQQNSGIVLGNFKLFEKCQVLLGTPPLDLLRTAINVKYLLMLKLEDDILHCKLDASSSFLDSVANLLESLATQLGTFLKIQIRTRYKQQDVSLFINHLWSLRWKHNDKMSFLKSCNEAHQLNTLYRPFSISKGMKPSKYVNC